MGGVVSLVATASVVWAAGATLFHHDVGVVNGKAITESQLLWYMFSRDSEDVVKDLVFFNVVADEAAKLGVSVDPAQAEAVLNEVHGDRAGTVFNSLNREEVKTAILRELTAREVMRKKQELLAKDPVFAVTDQEIVTAYLQNTDRMVVREQVVLSIINTSNLKTAESALTAIKDGLAFSEAAKQYSEDEVTRPDGGRIDRPISRGYFRGPLKKLDEIAFQLPIGGHSNIISAVDQYFIIQVDEKIPAKEISLDEARPVLKDKIEGLKIAPAVADWLQSIGAAATLDITYPIFDVTDQDLRNLNLPPGGQAAPAESETP